MTERRYTRKDLIEWPKDKYGREIQPGTKIVFNSGGSDLRIGTVREVKQKKVWYITHIRTNSVQGPLWRGQWKAEVDYDDHECTVKDVRNSIVMGLTDDLESQR